MGTVKIKYVQRKPLGMIAEPFDGDIVVERYKCVLWGQSGLGGVIAGLTMIVEPFQALRITRRADSN